MATATIILPVQTAKLPTTNPAQLDAGEGNWRLLFDDTTDESCLWQFRLPVNFASAPVLKVQFSILTTAAGTDTAAFEAAVMAVTPDDAADIVTDSYDAVNAFTKVLAADQTAGFLKEASVSLTNFDSGAAGDYIKIKLNRDVSADDVVGDIEVVAVSLEYTTT